MGRAALQAVNAAAAYRVPEPAAAKRAGSPESTVTRRRPIRFSRMLFCVPLIGCLNTDFGRVRQSLVVDDIHAWMGPAATSRYGAPASVFRLTEDERLLRDLAYPLIEPPYERQRWFAVLNEYGLTNIFQPDWWTYDQMAYAQELLGSVTRTTDALYARLIDDVSNDVVRVGPFLEVARRVQDMDGKRRISLDHVTELTPPEHANAMARMNENALIVRWVHQSLNERAISYRLALERLVISAPSRQAAEAERQLTLMRMRIASTRVAPGPRLGRLITK
jgi:hypothetical protein